MPTTDDMLPELPDERPEQPFLGSEREVLDTWLEMYRQTVLLKVAGLTAEQLCRRSVPPSTMTLVGIVRHLTEVEAYWLREVLHGEELPDYYCTEQSRDGDFDDYTPDTALADVRRYGDEIAATAAAAAGWTDLDGPVTALRHGRPVNLRWILTHLIEEYARHLGHMDLLREAVDGRTGY